MDWLKALIVRNPFLALLFPTGLGGFNFFGNLMAAMSDGVIDSVELHQLLSSASGLETVILLVIMFALNEDTKKKRK